MHISIIHGKTYEYLTLECKQLGIRQWLDGKAELLAEFADETYKTYELTEIKTINISDTK